MNEPSILDYLKSKLGMTDGEKIEFPSDEFAVPAALYESEETQDTDSKPETFQPSHLLTGGFPWRSLLALLLALMGQAAFEPPRHSGGAGIILFFAAFIALGFAYKLKEWRLPVLRDDEFPLDDLLFKKKAFFWALPFTLVAFLTFAGNRFTFINVFFWLISLFLFIWSFWQSDISPTNWVQNLKSFFQQRDWRINISRWTLLLLAASATVLFFRVYQIGVVPAEPFSDHAEKILDVYDITQGETKIFFERNTGREALQMYWTLFIARVFGTGLSFFSLKLGTVLLGLMTLPYMYLLGKEVANRRVGLIAMFFMGIAYWPNVISRVGLRFPLYPLFVAPTLFYLLRGIRRQSRNDFILAGLFLGLGLHGYSPFRIMPIVVLVAIGLYLLHKQSRGTRWQVIIQLLILALFSIIVFLPLGRYAMGNPVGFSARAFSRLGESGVDSWKIFADNLWDGARMINWNNGDIWVHSVAGRPALGVVSGALFLVGVVLLFIRYLRRAHWQDLFLLLSIILLQLPSTLSIAFPEENPALNRAAGAVVVVFLIVALALDGLLTSLRSRASRGLGKLIAWVVPVFLVALSLNQNYDLVFNKYAENYRLGSWNSSEMGQVIKQFEQIYGQTDTVWIVPYAHWVDTRLPGLWAGIPNRDFALWPDDLAESLREEGPKLFMTRPDDEVALAVLAKLYPNGTLSRYTSASDIEGHDFMIFSVP